MTSGKKMKEARPLLKNDIGWFLLLLVEAHSLNVPIYRKKYKRIFPQGAIFSSKNEFYFTLYISALMAYFVCFA